ncbi:MAG: NUDIX hydrolase [Candidatus Diapherotrites archaeon]
MKYPGVGVAVFIRKDGKVLLGLRQGSHGADTWALPGGKLDFGESLETCCAREVLEETNLHITNIKPGPYTNDIFKKEGKHYITLFFTADYASGELKIMEPQKCKEWRWVEWGALPRPLFLPLENVQRKGFSPFGKQL